MLESIIRQLIYNPDEPLMFSSGLFLFLFLGFSLIYMLLNRQQTLRLLFVTLFSYYFYYKTSGWCVVLLAVVTLSDFLIARAMGAAGRWGRKCLVTASLLVNLGLLGYFKYTNFLFGTWADIVGRNFQPWDIVLPVGISFFTFQSLSYTIDVYRGHMKPLRSLLDYAFFVSFFPTLVAGPIIRARDFVPQIRKPLTVTDDMFARGVYFVMVGLFKKAVISDYISLNFVDRIFDNPALYSGVENLLGCYAYALQIYCDFSGYSDMAIGIALLLGFHFPLNFRTPYISESITDFWRRWHISLSSWIKDYIYISLGGNRKGHVRTYINLLLTMLLGGLWHGASFNFVVWGGMHGVALSLHKFFRQYVFRHGHDYRSHGVKRLLGVLLTFHFVVLAWVFFRASSFDVVYVMLMQIFTEFHAALFGQVVYGYRFVMVLVLLGYVTHFFPEAWEGRLLHLLKEGGVVLCAILMAVVIWMVIQVKTSTIQPFIYFQF